MVFAQKLSLVLSGLFLYVSVVFAATREELAIESKKGYQGIIQLDDFNFKEILSGPRDFYFVTLLTATDASIDCAACHDFEHTFNVIADSWTRDHKNGISNFDESKALYFAKSDITDVNQIPEIFKYYEVEKVPRLMFFTPGGSIKDYNLLNLPQHKGNAGAAEFIQNLKVAIGVSDYEIYEPFDWSSVFYTAFIAFAVVYLVKKQSKAIYSIISSKLIWGTVSSAFIILMCGGYMYNQMRGTPYAGSTKEGGVVYFYPNEFQNQFGIETQIVGVVYAILSAGFVGLVLGIPKLNNYYKNSASGDFIIFIMTVITVIIMYVFFAGLTSLFIIKSPAYPYQLIKLSSMFGQSA